MRVLLCDDHVLFAESLATVLTQAGHEVTAVTYSPAAVLAALTRAEPPDACVLDVGYGSDTILHWLADLRAAAPRTLLVLLTAHVDAALVTTALDAGVRGLVHKSQHITDIVAVLRRVAAGEVAVDPALVASPAAVPVPRAPSHRAEAHELARFLTPREREALGHLVRGLDSRQLAQAMGVTWGTARTHVQSVLTKLGVHSRLEAAAVAVRTGLISAETGEWRAA